MDLATSYAELLRTQVQRSAFISSVSVYGYTRHRPVLETDPLLPPVAEEVAEINGATC